MDEYTLIWFTSMRHIMLENEVIERLDDSTCLGWVL